LIPDQAARLPERHAPDRSVSSQAAGQAGR